MPGCEAKFSGKQSLMARVLLDTQCFVLLATEGLGGLPRRAQRAVDEDDNERLLSAVSITEIAIKVNAGRLRMTGEDVVSGASDLRLTVLPYEARHARRLFALPLHHADPFDRMLIATALAEDIPIISGDRAFKQYQGVRVIW